MSHAYSYWVKVWGICLWRKWVLYSTLNVHVIQHWSMFVRLMQKNASLCGLFCHRLPDALPRWRMTPVWFQPGFFDCSSKNGECWENEIIKVGCLFTFLIGEWHILPLTGRKKSKQCPGKICRCSNFAYLHGVEWDRLIVHRTPLT